MKSLVAAVAALALSLSVYANDFQAATAKALAAGDAAAVVKALEKENYRGNIVAAQQLGLMYRDGNLVPQDHAKARAWLQAAAAPNWKRAWHKSGLAEAQYALGIMLRDGIGGKADAEAAASWFERAAVQGEGQAQLALAHMQLKGSGIKQNIERAFIWASIAAKWLTEAAQKEAEHVRELAQKQLGPKQLEKAETLVSNWTPKTL
jgi:uncharacterized protein